EAYSHECASAGWWPGNGSFGRAAFYAYTYPEPDGYRRAGGLPTGDHWAEELGEHVLPWDAALAAPDADRSVLAFLDATWEAAATAGSWDRSSLERPPGEADALEEELRAWDRPLPA